jgi:hypothetical protein
MVGRTGVAKAAAHEPPVIPGKCYLNGSEKYLSSLAEFAALVKLPLLLAWNYKGMWLLVDQSHFERNVTGVPVNGRESH